MNKDYIKQELFLDLLNAGYKNALATIIDFNFGKTRIEIDVPNVGSLRVYQSFSEIDDVQIPIFAVFYTLANKPNIQTKITDNDLKSRAINIVYKCKKYFESHPEHIVDNEKNLINRTRKNKQMMQKLYNDNMKHRNRWLLVFENQK